MMLAARVGEVVQKEEASGKGWTRVGGVPVTGMFFKFDKVRHD